MRNGKIANMSWLAAVLVVGIHVGNWRGVTDAFSAFAMAVVVRPFLDLAVPYFFFVSGLFLARHMNDEGWWRGALRKRVRTLLVPLLVFDGLSLVVDGFNVVSHDPSAISWSWTLTTLGFDLLDFPGHDVMWFVRSLFLLVVLAPALKTLVDRLPRVTLVVLGMAALIHIPFVFGPDAAPWTRLFKYTFAPNGLFAFVLGLAIGRHGVPAKASECLSGRRAIAALWVGVGLLFALRSVLYAFKAWGFGSPTVMGWADVIVTEVSIPVMTAALFRIVPNREVPWAWTSFAVFALHTYLLAVLKAVGLPPASAHVGLFVLYTVALSIGATLVAYWLRDNVRVAADVLFGGRLGLPRQG